MVEGKVHTVIVKISIEGCDSLDEANDHVKGWLNECTWPRTHPRILQAKVATDFETGNVNQRIFSAHPIDTDESYNVTEYITALEVAQFSKVLFNKKHVE